MKSLMLLLSSMLQDCSIRCSTTTTRDLNTITRRVEHEGISFLTITLSDFAQDFERSLELGHIESTFFRSFSKNGSIPKLFSGMTTQVFNADGRLLDQPSIDCILCIRQICRMFKKILLPCSKERELAAVDSYIKIESDLTSLGATLQDNPLWDIFGAVADTLWSQVLGEMVDSINNRVLIPRHGTGATSLKVLPNQKYVWSEWHLRLEPYFPSDVMCYHNTDAFLDECDSVKYLLPEQERPVRVVFVPKTLKTPRVIGIEPACMQYTQQALLTDIVRILETHPLTRGHVNFSDQSINAKLALSSSKDGSLATLDLKDASDRVHHAIVWRMLKSVPLLRDAVFACRSTSATLPTGQTIQLEKFASMGSALCFPIESMVFFTILVSQEVFKRSLRLKQCDLKNVIDRIFVYGDDIIIPTDMVLSATHALETFGLKVNSAKSFGIGKFRESCGMDAYDGVDITPVYVRRLFPSSRRDGNGLVSAIALRNQLLDKGFDCASRCVEKILEKIYPDIPVVSRDSPCVGYYGENLSIHRLNKELHRHEVFGLVVVKKPMADRIDGHHALMKYFLNGLSRSRRTYSHSMGSGDLVVKRRWSPVYSYGVDLDHFNLDPRRGRA